MVSHSRISVRTSVMAASRTAGTVKLAPPPPPPPPPAAENDDDDEAAEAAEAAPPGPVVIFVETVGGPAPEAG